ncbi:MAG: nucleotide exchange factor GrpE [Candidatus Falkowbacteria bacterium]|nr:nucleotide exchange factor GrpE [Candidatus Falkowbacteria bacterium]
MKDDKLKAIKEEANKEPKPGIYLCHTGNEYRVLFTAFDTKDHESEVVVYQGVLDDKIWVRPKEEFLGFKEINGEQKKRFVFLRDEEFESWEHKYKRALADYQNLLKQTASEKAEFAKYALTDFLEDILPVYDHLKMSIAGLKDEDHDNPWVAGVKHVLKQFKDTLASKGLEEIKTTGAKFDHNTMEALEGKGDRVKQEVRAGYKLNGRVIRPAKVIVE